MKLRRWAAREPWILGACIAAAVTAALAGTGAEPVSQAVSRDAIWRSIFVRPAQLPFAASRAEDAAKAALGGMLFSDTRLSGDGSRTCASCHNPARGFTDGLAKAQARDGTALLRNTPSLYNLAWSQHFFADYSRR